ncbi:hypothetical protein KIL84_022815 [Mauremys mutica]|uniref:Uncharacterized protein n=1 Tax=Mauremys mutica TaxID=74926 RepID=A0A9D4AQZ0_9SAUR|nr:hypothetical protein KIL84_022815 [Mauremys mutica]
MSRIEEPGGRASLFPVEAPRGPPREEILTNRGDPSKSSSQGPPPIRVQHHYPISPSAGQRRPFLTKHTCFRKSMERLLRGNMDSFTTPVRTSDFVLDPSTILMWRRRYVSDSSEEEEGVTEGSPLAQPMMDTSEPKPETLVRHPEEPDGLSLSTPSDRHSGESPVDKANGKDGAQVNE